MPLAFRNHDIFSRPQLCTRIDMDDIIDTPDKEDDLSPVSGSPKRDPKWGISWVPKSGLVLLLFPRCHPRIKSVVKPCLEQCRKTLITPFRGELRMCIALEGTIGMIQPSFRIHNVIGCYGTAWRNMPV